MSSNLGIDNRTHREPRSTLQQDETQCRLLMLLWCSCQLMSSTFWQELSSTFVDCCVRYFRIIVFVFVELRFHFLSSKKYQNFIMLCVFKFWRKHVFTFMTFKTNVMKRFLSLNLKKKSSSKSNDVDQV